MDGNDEIVNSILSDFKILNKIDTTEYDNLFTLIIKKAVQTILNLTRRKIFPKELKYVALDIANELYINQSLLGQATNGEVTGSIKTISEEGRSVTFGSSQESTINSLLSTYINDNLNLRLKEIYNYRLLYNEVVSDDEQD